MTKTPVPNRRSAAKGHSLLRAVVGIPRSIVARRDDNATRPAAAASTLPPAVSGERREIASAAGRLSYYAASPPDQTSEAVPLLLIHSINAAGSAYEVRPLFEHYRQVRPVYAMDLPGFGFSERSDRLYIPRLMTDAVHAMVAEIGRLHGGMAIDALALSLSCEFLARASTEIPDRFRSLALISPTGFDKRAPRLDQPGSNRGKPLLRKIFSFRLWGKSLFRLLCSRASIRYFLEKTWGAKHIDEGLLDYDYATTHQSGASFAPYCFISGFLFSNDITRIYQELAGPVWMAHGEKGDFTDFSYEHTVESKPNWTLRSFPTGALPHFEMCTEFVADYDAFVAVSARDRIQDGLRDSGP